MNKLEHIALAFLVAAIVFLLGSVALSAIILLYVNFNPFVVISVIMFIVIWLIMYQIISEKGDDKDVE